MFADLGAWQNLFPLATKCLAGGSSDWSQNPVGIVDNNHAARASYYEENAPFPSLGQLMYPGLVETEKQGGITQLCRVHFPPQAMPRSQCIRTGDFARSYCTY